MLSGWADAIKDLCFTSGSYELHIEVSGLLVAVYKAKPFSFSQCQGKWHRN